MGLKVAFADCQTYPMYLGKPWIKTTTIMVEMGDLYPDAMLAGLPDGWTIELLMLLSENTDLLDLVIQSITLNVRAIQRAWSLISD